MNEVERIAAWAQGLVKDRMIVLHKPTRTIDRVTDFFDGVERKSIGANGQPLTSPVLRTESGHTFLANPENFSELDAAAVSFFVGAQKQLADLVAALAAKASASRMSMATFQIIVSSVLEMQLRVLHPR